MQVWSSTRKSRSVATDSRKGGVSGLRKSEVMADIFNHKPSADSDKGDARVHLSHTSRALTQEFYDEVTGFLSGNKPIADQLAKIELPGEELEGHHSAKLTLRRFGSYFNWLKIKQSSDIELPDAEGEAPYRAIHTQGKDDAINKIVADHESRREQAATSRKKNPPNYYYLIYPETYAFN